MRYFPVFPEPFGKPFGGPTEQCVRRRGLGLFGREVKRQRFRRIQGKPKWLLKEERIRRYRAERSEMRTIFRS